jgi:hypothetical protein
LGDKKGNGDEKPLLIKKEGFFFTRRRETNPIDTAKADMGDGTGKIFRTTKFKATS